MSEFEKTDDGRLRVSKEETIVVVNEYTVEQIDQSIFALDEHLQKMEAEIQEHKIGLENLKELRKKCTELDVKPVEVGDSIEVAPVEEIINP